MTPDTSKKLTDFLDPMKLEDEYVWIDKTFTKEEWKEFEQQILKNQIVERIIKEIKEQQKALDNITDVESDWDPQYWLDRLKELTQQL